MWAQKKYLWMILSMDLLVKRQRVRVNERKTIKRKRELKETELRYSVTSICSSDVISSQFGSILNRIDISGDIRRLGFQLSVLHLPLQIWPVEMSYYECLIHIIWIYCDFGWIISAIFECRYLDKTIGNMAEYFSLTWERGKRIQLFYQLWL